IDDQLAIAKHIVDDPAYAEEKMDSTISQVVITDVMVRGKSWLEFNNYEVFNIVNWKNPQRDIGIIYNARGFNSSDKLEFMWTLEGYQSEWEVAPYSMMDERMNMATFSRLEPGKYIFRVRV